ncbi:MAG TPA: thioredoxin domain-containing protein [Vicinamibacterales bacterium]|nr:thioredoxin domain-containing protein [Vicinamibacterales bacterium]
MAGQVVSVSDTDFRSQVLLSKQPVLVAFRAGWCVPSQQLAPIVDVIADKYKGRVRVATVEVGPKTERLCRAYKVDRLPVMMVFKDGEPKDVIGGATDASNITGMLEMQLKPVVELSELNFNREVLRGSHPVLVHFWAAWCRQSLEMEQVIHDVAVKFQGRAKVARLEMRPDTMRLFARYDVARVPTTVVFQDGVVRDQILGAMTGGTKTGEVATSCVGLTSVDNIGQMLERFAL